MVASHLLTVAEKNISVDEKVKKPKIVKISLFMKWEFKITKPFLVNLIQQFAILLLLTVFKTVEYNRLY